MPTYLIDSNAVSELMRNSNGSVARIYRNKELDPNATLLTSIVSACELRYGAAKKGSAS